MANLRFDWDARKNAANKHKHGVSFESARIVFYSGRALLIEDPDENDEEDRFVLLGISGAARVGGVPLLQREGLSDSNDLARKANRKEREDYEKQWK